MELQAFPTTFGMIQQIEMEAYSLDHLQLHDFALESGRHLIQLCDFSFSRWVLPTYLLQVFLLIFSLMKCQSGGSRSLSLQDWTWRRSDHPIGRWSFSGLEGAPRRRRFASGGLCCCAQLFDKKGPLQYGAFSSDSFTTFARVTRVSCLHCRSRCWRGSFFFWSKAFHLCHGY